jgi:hypothetical protein
VGVAGFGGSTDVKVVGIAVVGVGVFLGARRCLGQLRGWPVGCRAAIAAPWSGLPFAL